MTNNTNKMSISPIITALEESFDYLNNRFYDGALPRADLESRGFTHIKIGGINYD